MYSSVIFMFCNFWVSMATCNESEAMAVGAFGRCFYRIFFLKNHLIETFLVLKIGRENKIWMLICSIWSQTVMTYVLEWSFWWILLLLPLDSSTNNAYWYAFIDLVKVHSFLVISKLCPYLLRDLLRQYLMVSSDALLYSSPFFVRMLKQNVCKLWPKLVKYSLKIHSLFCSLAIVFLFCVSSYIFSISWRFKVPKQFGFENAIFTIYITCLTYFIALSLAGKKYVWPVGLNPSN